MPSEIAKKGLKDGLLTQKQYDKLPVKLLEGIVASKRKKGVKPNKMVKPSGKVRQGKRRKKGKGTGK
tara:strand:- start:5133 stop:5333 length:201 start_codon:yes stop_codon:yes gene_type:complete